MPPHTCGKLFLAFRCLLDFISCADIETYRFYFIITAYLQSSIRILPIRKWWCWWTLEIRFECSRWRFLYSNFMDFMEHGHQSVKWPCEQVKFILFIYYFYLFIRKVSVEKSERVINASTSIKYEIRMERIYAARRRCSRADSIHLMLHWRMVFVYAMKNLFY